MSEKSTADRIAEIEARAQAATPGPWGWRGNVDSHNVHLRSLARDSDYPDVLRFHRSGMQGGKPVFNRPECRGLIDVNLTSKVIYQVCPDATSRDDRRVYRGDIIGIRHPDAEFIAHARQDVETLLARVRELEAALASAEAA